MSSLISSVEGILCYEGNVIDIVLNYTAIAATIVPTILIYCYLPLEYEHLRLFWIPYVILLFIFQVSLCLIVGCFGVSIVWSALCSFAIYSYVLFISSRSYSIPLGNLVLIQSSLSTSTLFSILLWIYYAVVADFITSLAHLCAVLLGLVSGLALKLHSQRRHRILQYETVLNSPST